MNKYGPKAQKTIEDTMDKYSRGELKSGSGDKVTSRKQAVAIGISEARRKGFKTPSEK
jgi:hypothetical protein